MESFGEFFAALFKVWIEMIKAFLSVLPTVFKFSLWILSAIIILPCVYVAGSLFPLWVEWGEDF